MNEETNMNTDYFKIRYSDAVYNNFRRLLKDAQNICLRQVPNFPRPGAKSKSRS